MSKTAAISEDTHLLIIEKQLEILKRYGVQVRITDIINAVMTNYIDKTEECLQLDGRERPGINDRRINDRRINDRRINDRRINDRSINDRR